MGIGKAVGETALDLAKNENVLNKTADVMEMLFPYAGLTKKAVDMYIAEIEKSDLSMETKIFTVLNAKKTIKKMKNQKKIATIAMENAKEGTDFTDRSGVNEEWLERFMESASLVTSEDIQLIWGKILGNEFETPGSTPPNMIRILSEITPIYAQAFRKICSMQMLLVFINNEEKIAGATWKIMVPYKQNNLELRKIGLSFDMLNELETLGLIKFESIGGYITRSKDSKKVLVYIDGKTETIDECAETEIPIGNVMLTAVGECLRRITMPEKIVGYNEWVKKYMVENGIKYMEKSNYQVSVINEDEVQVLMIEE